MSTNVPLADALAMGTSSSQSIVRIFISSRGDVNEEREQARRVVDNLQRHYTGAKLVTVFWEDLGLSATATFQQGIDILLNEKSIDVAVFIL